MSWEHEKAYCSRRAQELTAEMIEAIESFDLDRFDAAYQASARYMSKKQRSPLYKKMIERIVNS